jgi:hypothetical protein
VCGGSEKEWGERGRERERQTDREKAYANTIAGTSTSEL